jgi:DNA-binding CsgD family transcriptional regulator/tetratricopeptide (TPR) repeat protein
MLEPIRQYAREKLEESEEAYEVRSRHTAFFLALAEGAELDGPEQRIWVERLEVEHDNLREALSRVLEAAEADLGLRFGGALWRFWYQRGYLSEGIGWMERVLAGSEPAPAPARVKALEGMGWLTQFQADFGRAEATYAEMLERARALGDKGNVATALNSLGTVAAQQGDNERARALLQENMEVLEDLEEEGNPATTLKRFHALNLLGYLAIYEDDDYAGGTALWEESLELAREIGDPNQVGIMLSNLGHPALLQRDFERARALSEETLAFAQELGSSGVELVPTASLNLGLALLGLGEHEQAATPLENALVMSQDMGRKPQVLETLEGMASLAVALGKDARAARLWGAAEAARGVTGIALSPGERGLHEPYLATARSRLGEADWEEALAEGRAKSLEEAAAYALSKEKQPTAHTTTVAEESSPYLPSVVLTPREKEVALLVAQELTNRQIASALTLSEHTVATHIRNVLKKLGLVSRNQVAAWVREHQPLS